MAFVCISAWPQLSRRIAGDISMTKAYGTVPEAIKFSGLSRTGIYEALKRGDLTARKAGRRTLISFADLEAYLAALPTYRAGV